MDDFQDKVIKTLDELNKTFEIDIDEKKTPDGAEEEYVTKIVLKGLKNDGADFIEAFCSLFGPIIESMNERNKELVFEEGTGLTVRRVED